MKLDFSLLKNFPIRRISEAFNIQFRAGMLNILNTPSFVLPRPSSGDGNTTLVQSRRVASGRQRRPDHAVRDAGSLSGIPFALKLVW